MLAFEKLGRFISAYFENNHWHDISIQKVMFTAEFNGTIMLVMLLIVPYFKYLPTS